jgi:hypothetical protein
MGLASGWLAGDSEVGDYRTLMSCLFWTSACVRAYGQHG